MCISSTVSDIFMTHIYYRRRVCTSVCLSVCLSVCHTLVMYWLKTNDRRIMRFSARDASFWDQLSCPRSKWTPCEGFKQDWGRQKRRKRRFLRPGFQNHDSLQRQITPKWYTGLHYVSNKKLSCRREIAWRLVSLNILLSHSTSVS